MVRYCLYLCKRLCELSSKQKLNQNITTMKALSNFAEAACRLNYEAPTLEVVEVAIERGFEVSSEEGGFDGPSYGEEDVDW